MTQSGCSDKSAPAQAPQSEMGVEVERIAGEAAVSPRTPIEQRSASGLTVQWLPYGGHLHSVRMPDGTEVLAHYEDPEDYRGGAPYLGGLIGRVGNRIAGATFAIDGQDFTVSANENGHALHAGPEGFDTRIWDVAREGEELVFRHTSPAGHQGYPGNLDVTVRATLGERELKIKFLAITDAPTPVNLTQHGYWNPSGRFNQPIDTLRLTSAADRYTQVDNNNIPTGLNPEVDLTPLDFREARPIGPEPIDINLMVPGEGLREMAHLSDGVRTITVLSDYPGLQLFTGEALQGIPGVSPRGALAIEPQYPPNAVNQPVDGHDTILRPGEVYRHTIIYRFDGPGLRRTTGLRDQ